MSGKHIPEHLLETVEVRSLWFELNRHIVTMNDIVSLKKEMVRPTLPSFLFPCTPLTVFM